MQFKLKNKVKYIFPNPGSSNKEYVIGEISYIGDGKIILLCEDNSRLNISFKNFENIVPLEIADEITAL